jgi:hypothetical protein
MGQFTDIVAGGFAIIVLCSFFIITIVSILFLLTSRNDDLTRLSGFYAIKPIVVYLLVFFSISDPPSIATRILFFVLEIGLTVIIIYKFKRLYTKAIKLSWVFLALDMLRWLTLPILVLEGIRLPGWLSIMILLFPVEFLLIALIVSFVRRRRQVKVNQTRLEA